MKTLYYDGDIESNYLGHIMAEIYKDQVYAPYLIGRENLNIVDCGAHIGLFTLYASKFAKQIVSIEPDLDHFEALKKNTEGLPVTCINAGIGPKKGEFNFYKDNNLTMHSFNSSFMSPGTSRDRTFTKVPVITLSEALQSFERVDFVKFDVESLEGLIICGEDFPEAAKKIDMMVIEIHAFMDRNPNQLKDVLKNCGFKVNQIQNDAQLWIAQKI